MSINLAEITSLSHALVQQHGGGLAVATVVAIEGGTERVEIIVTIDGCHKGSCRFPVNVSRASGADFNREFTQKLKDALQKHTAQEQP